MFDFKDKKSLWEQDLEKAYDSTKKSDVELLYDLLNIIVFNRFGGHIGKLYKIINDVDKFSMILEEFSNKEFRFPDSDEFKKALTLAMVFYYREVLHFSWEEVQKQFPYESDIPLKYGKKISYLNKTLKEQLTEILTKEKTNSDIFDN